MTKQIQFCKAALAIALATLSGPANADDWEEQKRIQKERPAAIRALYGEGLEIKTTKDGSISLDWGALDAETWQRYVEEHYSAIGQGGFTYTNSEIVFVETFAYKNKTAAHYLVEPLEKLYACEHIAKAIEDGTVSDQMLDYCREKALEHIFSPTVAFRGKAVTYKTPRDYEGVSLGEPLFAGDKGKRDVLITVSAPGERESYRAAQAVKWIVNNMRYNADPRLKRLGRVAKMKAEDALAAAEKKIAKRDKKLAKKRGNVVFTDYYVDGWAPIKMLKKGTVPTCRQSYAHLYGPNAKGDYDVTVTANGKTCDSQVYRAGFRHHWSVYATCKKVLRPADNKITFTISKNVNKVAGKRWDRRQRREVKVYSNKAGKKMASGSMTCSD